MNNNTPSPNVNFGALKLRSANLCLAEASRTPIAKSLFGELWYEGEICLLFADTNAGKSIIAVQITNAITKGEPISPFSVGVSPQPVLYIDTELSTKQFETRYSVPSGEYNAQHFAFSPDFYRAELDADVDPPEKSSFEEFILDSIEKAVAGSGCRIVIVDNITSIGNENEKSSEALALMKRLKQMQRELGLSMLVLGHTKKRFLSAFITENDLAGSKMLMNLADSSFAVGKSVLKSDIRYIKQMKERNTEKRYGVENVITFRLEKIKNFLGFSFVGFEPENRHLISDRDGSEKEAVKARVIELTQQGLPRRTVAAEAGVSVGTVQNYLNN